ncbi:MAG TPA: ATP synthase subunit I [Rhizomicrobium sp.]|nr:ATP synthase subunit I [Rhizomicrobium sp.]
MILRSHMATAFAFVGIGAIVGYLHLMLLSWNVRALFGLARGAWAIAAPAVRGVVVLAAFSAAALQGAAPLVAALIGFLIARAVVLRRPEALLR